MVTQSICFLLTRKVEFEQPRSSFRHRHTSLTTTLSLEHQSSPEAHACTLGTLCPTQPTPPSSWMVSFTETTESEVMKCLFTDKGQVPPTQTAQRVLYVLRI